MNQLRANLAIACLALCLPATAQRPGVNYDEAEVPAYTLPDPLRAADGKRVTAATWGKRRQEILRLFETQVYGRGPEHPLAHSFSPHLLGEVLDGKATAKQVRVYFTEDRDDRAMDILIYAPTGISEPVPVFVGLNFSGNHATHADPAIPLSTAWMRQRGEDIVDNRATEASRGKSASRWPVELILERGYALATVYCGDIDPDYDEGFQDGVHGLFYDEGQTRPAADEWGTIAAWAWGLSRAMDWFEMDGSIDEQRVALVGHSRLGKAALWAGAQDQRFAMVISNESGCGGAALSRRRFGETVARINASFPHWFCDNFTRYDDNEDALPVDQHMLLALMAPRPLYVASAVGDRWADPRGEFLSAKHASEVYQMLGTEGLPVDEMPEVDQPVHGTIGYHVRSGDHDITTYDWQQYLTFAERHLGQEREGLFAQIETNKGQILARLEARKTPMTVANFVGLAEGTIDNDAFPAGRPYFDGSVWHRVVPGHVIQGGSPDSEAARGPGYQFPNEIDASLDHGRAGMLAMANGGPHTNSSQFYITLGDRSYLDGDYTVFGSVIAGMDVVHEIVQGDVIESVRIRRVGPEAERFRVTTARFRETVARAEDRVALEAVAKRRREVEHVGEKWPGAVAAESGLQYVVVKEGTGEPAAPGTQITVRYSGHTLAGLEFRSRTNGAPAFGEEGEAFELEIGARGVTPGFDEGASTLRPGETRVLIVPAALAYGRGGHYAPEVEGEPRFRISPHTMLVYEVERLR